MTERIVGAQEKPPVDESVVKNSMIAAAVNRWYGDIISLAAGSEKGLSLEEIRKGIIRQSSEERNGKSIKLPVETVAGAVTLLEATGVLQKGRKGHYRLTDQARRLLPTFEEASA